VLSCCQSAPPAASAVFGSCLDRSDGREHGASGEWEMLIGFSAFLESVTLRAATASRSIGLMGHI
jgi:hypothetical protein